MIKMKMQKKKLKNWVKITIFLIIVIILFVIGYNLYKKYDKKEVKKQDKSKLILIALGPTATILAYDLLSCNFYE